MRKLPRTLRILETFPLRLLLVGGAISVMFSGCVNIPVSEHRHLSRPNMVFESQGAFASRPSLLGQIEPGAAASAGGQAAGCTVCR